MSAPDSLPDPEPEPYCEWQETLRAVAESGGTTMLLGGMDVGKTTFTRLLVNRAIKVGRRVAVLDADIGQSEIGPPGCVGLAFADAPVQALSDLPPHALGFVGSVSPAAHLPEHITAVRRLADLVEDRFLIVDTSGYVQGSGARRLCQLEFELLAPAHVVALQRKDELNGILAPLRRRNDCVVHTPSVAAAIQSKPPSLRSQRRAMRFSAYFQNSETHIFSFADAAFLGTWLGSGVPLPAHLLKFLNTTLGPRIRVYYGETVGRHLGIMVNQPIPTYAPEIGAALEGLKAREITITVAPRLKHLLIGLDSANGKLLGLGLLVSLDFQRRLLGILTPVRAPSAARILRFGLQRVLPDGTDAGALRPGDI